MNASPDPARTILRRLIAIAVLGAMTACHPAAAPVTPPADVFPPTWSLHRPAIPVEGRAGMVASGHPLASQVGADVLARGGNAIDAAVAVGFALAVVLPEAGNIGGGGYLVHRDASGEAVALDYRETAPAAASRDMYLGPDGKVTDRSRIGHLASGVPGSVAGLAAMHERLGSRPWRELVEPAIALARGHVFDDARRRNREAAIEKLQRFPSSLDLLLPGGVLPEVGSTFANPDLARTLARIAEHGADDFYRGETADLVAAEMERGGGLITREDLAAYRPQWREPLRVAYRGNTLWTMPPSSSGGVTLAMILDILGGWDILPRFGSAELYNLEIEAMRWAYVDRNRWLGDPDFVEMPLDRLLSKRYGEELRRRIVPGRAGKTPLEPALSEGTQTTHYSIVDSQGSAASVTTTINSLYGNGVVVAGAGFLLNDEMDDFAAKPGTPNQFGLVQGESNAIEPGKRMLSSMSPTIVADRRGKLSMVVGSPGGATIITSVFQVISNVIDHHMTLARAVAAPRIHHQALPDRVFYEPHGLAPAVRDRLAAMGYALEQREEWSGDIQAIARSRDGGWIGVADPRRGGGAVGVDAVVEGARKTATR
ncbi:MAG TPA: gamma-glutamyltransferase [Thermoanaerobaculia bacterium]|nr:gamma-glutamyltransferase [Thermoanaerobaculia bacterium]